MPSTVDRFVEQYLIDRDPFAAALRAGVPRATVKVTVRKWMADQKVIDKINAKTADLDPNKMISPQWVIAKFQEVASSRYSSFSAKNTALRELASIAKMYPSKEKEIDDRPHGVVILPGDADLGTWEQAAMKQQKALKENVGR